jgi:hypothetical protein
VAANASHCFRMVSMFRVMNWANRMLDTPAHSPLWRRA